MIFVALGANISSSIGEPAQTLRAALARMEASGINIVMCSSFYKTRAWPDPSDPPFTNGVAQLTTALAPAALLAALHAVETDFGRRRTRPNAPRTLDLDLLDYDGRVEAGPPILPHPRIAERDFVLRPLCEIAPGWHHPVLGLTAAQLLARLPDDKHTGENIR